MSYRIEHRGPREEVIAAVKTAFSIPKDGDQTVVEGEKVAVLAAIKALPSKYTGIRVLAFGDIYPMNSEARREVGGYIIEGVVPPKTPDPKSNPPR